MEQVTERFNVRTITDINALIDARQRYSPAAIRAVKAFAKAKPWRGDISERKDKVRDLHDALTQAYQVRQTLDIQIDPIRAFKSFYRVRPNSMQLTGKLSVITYLIGFGQLRGFNAEQSYKWAMTLFKRCFPKSFENLEMRGGWIVKRAG